MSLDWLIYVADIFGGMDGRTPEACEAGHDIHEVIPVAVSMGVDWAEGMVVFDASQYEDVDGFCPGDDAISRVLKDERCWEFHNFLPFLDALALADPDEPVLDIGSHLGWYTCLATTRGFNVLAVCPDAEQLELLHMNVAGNHAPRAAAVSAWTWIDENTPVIPVDGSPMIAMVKIDIEGSERHAVRVLRELLQARKIRSMMMECSPIFNNSYRDLVSDIISYGYIATMIGPPTVVITNSFVLEELLATWPQFDIMFRRIEDV